MSGEHNAGIDAPVEENRRLREETQTLASELKSARKQSGRALEPAPKRGAPWSPSGSKRRSGMGPESTDTLQALTPAEGCSATPPRIFPIGWTTLCAISFIQKTWGWRKTLRDHIEGFKPLGISGASGTGTAATAGSFRAGRHCKANGKAHRVVGTDTDITLHQASRGQSNTIAAGTGWIPRRRVFPQPVPPASAGAMEVAAAW